MNTERTLSEFHILRELAEDVYERLTESAIRIFSEDGPCLFEVDGATGLKSCWEEMCYYFKEGGCRFALDKQNLMVYMYNVLEGEIAKLKQHERDSAWLRTKKGAEWDCEDESERDVNPVCSEDIRDHVIDEYLKYAAWKYESESLDKYMEQFN